MPTLLGVLVLFHKRSIGIVAVSVFVCDLNLGGATANANTTIVSTKTPRTPYHVPTFSGVPLISPDVLPRTAVTCSSFPRRGIYLRRLVP
jgi:hypothetical protein